MKKKIYSNPEIQVYALMPMQIICDSPTGNMGMGEGGTSGLSGGGGGGGSFPIGD